VIIIYKKGLGPVLDRMILIAENEHHHLSEFIGYSHNGVIGLSILYRVQKLDDQVSCNNLK